MDDEDWLTREDALNMLTATVRVAKVAKSSADGTGDTVQGHEDGAPSDEQFDLAARRIWPFGIRSVPPAGVDAVWVRSGGSTNGVMVGAESSRFGPSDLADGEVALYNKTAGVLVRLGSDGTVNITAGVGKTVNVNGSTYSMLQTESLLSDLTAWVTAINAVIASNCVNGAALSGYTGHATAIAAFATALGAAGAYKSTLAKNG